MATLKWVQESDIDWRYTASRSPAEVCLQIIRGGKPQQNGFIESFNGKLRPSHACKHALPGSGRTP